MKKHLSMILIIVFGFNLNLVSQNSNFTRLFYENPGMFNPAATGLISDDYISSGVNYEKYGNIPSNYFRLGMNFGYEKSIDKMNSSFAIYQNYYQEYNLRYTNNLGVSYNYKFKFDDNHFLKLGVQLNLNSITIDFSELIFSDFVDPTTGEVLSLDTIGVRTGIKPDINLGIWYEWKKFSMGVSIINMFNPDIIIIENDIAPINFNQTSFYTFLARYDLPVIWNMELTPGIYYYLPGYQDVSFNYLYYSLQLNYKKVVYFGSVYTSDNDSSWSDGESKWSVFAGANLFKRLKLRVSYSFPVKDERIKVSFIEGLVGYSFN